MRDAAGPGACVSNYQSDDGVGTRRRRNKNRNLTWLASEDQVPERTEEGHALRKENPPLLNGASGLCGVFVILNSGDKLGELGQRFGCEA